MDSRLTGPGADPWLDRLSEYVDDELDAPTRAALDAHLETCAECRAVRDDLARVVARARRVPYRAPAGDLWSPIEAAIGESIAAQPRHAASIRRSGRRLITLSIGRLAAAAAFVAVVAGGLAWTIATQRQSAMVLADREPDSIASPAVAPPTDAADASTAAMGSASARAVASYRDAARDLERVLDEGRATLRPETMRVIEENLRAIDVAIAQADSALGRDPGSAYLNQYLAQTMQRKLKLLRRAVEITTARS